MFKFFKNYIPVIENHKVFGIDRDVVKVYFMDKETGRKIDIIKNTPMDDNIKVKAEITSGSGYFIFNLRKKILDDENDDNSYMRALEVVPESNREIRRNYIPISWVQVFLYEYPRLFLRKRKGNAK